MAIKERSTGALAAATTTSLDFGAPYVHVWKVRYVSSADVATDFAIVDADSREVIDIELGDYTTAVNESRDFGVFKNPLSFSSAAAPSSGTYTITVWGEV